MEENAVQNVTTVEDRTRQSPAHPSWRWVFLVLLVATLLSALVSTYILITGKRPTLVNEQPNPEIDNPFVGQANTTNPFAADTVTSNSSNAFTDTATNSSSSNPFSQFDSDSSNTSQAGASGTYQNPF